MAISTVSRRALTHANRALLGRAFFSSRSARLSDDKSAFPFRQGPAPLRLPKEEQEIFEQLQRQSTGAFSTPQEPPKINQSPDSELETQAGGEGEEGLHRDLRSGLQPEFEGEKNPKTGEVGGPKNEPLRWGSAGDWSYGGRVTDF
ncbi:hypothetical protein P175DRAFT_0555304 [Aspergillus ochraceoroseus IBT 24754]|uniref:Succinate dehydrogenase assembly factor 4, mitochondrial n=3 Tax=Aspergillus subgen. Nidulantes TaxID=2720870 RepID=A0A0F8WRG6_9EURO|nr:uncharacterized protein P175DRAFT_0555304 [Aspergillus ochraceoroseus IBT 24754]KKK17056.1 hypothetical protein AOCH_004359 [Aspergillus ochraceoroseus]KKK20235.1 hypothetical protein ARAM_004888 [Aspergillus rambellii]PTU22640.1 hypothetical protein P175DRAFT_0555304 [Aspergillus ochraceoroseus IBT 24754]